MTAAPHQPPQSAPALDRASLETLLTTPSTPVKNWTIEDSEELYRIDSWGHPYFSINADGHLTVSPGAIGVAPWTYLTWCSRSSAVICTCPY